MALIQQTENDFIGKGWSFPPAFNKAIQSVELSEGNEDIRQSLHILLTTTTGERVMEPRYGCNVDYLLFESPDTTTKTFLKDKIRTAILYFEPRIDVSSVTINHTDEINGQLVIEIGYTIRGTNSRFNFVFPYFENEGTEVVY